MVIIKETEMPELLGKFFLVVCILFLVGLLVFVPWAAAKIKGDPSYDRVVNKRAIWPLAVVLDGLLATLLVLCLPTVAAHLAS